MNKNMINVLVADFNSLTVYEKEVDGNSEKSLSQVINSNFIDYDYHSINGKEYVFIVDDGSMKIRNPMPSVLRKGIPLNFGTTIICKSNKGHFVGLNEEEITQITNRIRFLKEDCDHPERNYPTVFVD